MSTEEPMSIEDRVRTATKAGATLVRDIGPLTAGQERVLLHRRPAPAARRLGSWGIPLAAAAAVALVAVSLVAIRSVNSGAPAGHPAAATTPTMVPRYYAAIDARDLAYGGLGPLITGDDALIVGDDVTGKAIATVEPPPGLHFDSVQAASDDRTFVVLANPRDVSLGGSPGPGPETLYLLRIAPGTAHPYQLAKLPIKLQGDSSEVVAYALSPGDRELAVESEDSFGGQINRLAIYSVPTGAELRAWTANNYFQGAGFQQTLSWLPGGQQLAFSNVPPGHSVQQDQLRTIDVTGPGTNLLADSRVVKTVTNNISSAASCWTMNLTPDGGTVICGTQYAYSAGGTGTSAGCASGGLELNAYSARTGEFARVLYRYRGACSNGLAAVLWTDSSARNVIGVTETDFTGGTAGAGQLGVITDGHLRLLKLPESVSPKEYLSVAF